MASITSFYYAIFKKLQAVAGGGSEHVDPPTPGELSGGFSLKSTTDPNGIKGVLSPAASIFAPLGYGDIAPGMAPITPNDFDPTHSPLFMMLSEALKASPQNLVMVNGKNWPTMPPPWILPYAIWDEFNPPPANNPNRLVAKLGAWIAAGQIDDAPKQAPIEFNALQAASVNLKAFSNIAGFGQPILFVASKPNDDGRRHNDGASPAVPMNHIPDNFWDTAQIFLTDTGGTTLPLAQLGTLKAGAEYYVAAIIGNAGNFGAGRGFFPGDDTKKLKVSGHGLAFNTHMSPDVLLPPLSNLDPTLAAGLYEEYYLPTEHYVVGFRFNVDQVFAGLAAKIQADPNFNLGGAADAVTWLKGSHACVKVLIESGEASKIFPANNDPNAKLTLDSVPQTDRHIAQKNLVAFDMSEMAAKKIWWKNFVVSQAGQGLNELVLEHDLPPEAFRFYVAMPSAVYEHYVAKQGHKGFDQVREGIASKPFPDCVVLRQSVRGAELRIAEHAHERYLGLSIGIEVEARGRTVHAGDVRMVHRTIDRRIAGGFTVRLTQGRRAGDRAS